MARVFISNITEDTERRRPWEEGGRDWSATATSRGAPGAPSSRRRQGRIVFPEPPE